MPFIEDYQKEVLNHLNKQKTIQLILNLSKIQSMIDKKKWFKKPLDLKILKEKKLIIKNI